MTQKKSVKKIQKKTVSSFPNLFPSVLNKDEFEALLDYFQNLFDSKMNRGISFEIVGNLREHVLSSFHFFFDPSKVSVRLVKNTCGAEINPCIFTANLESQDFKETAYRFLETIKKFDEKISSSEFFLYDKLAMYFSGDNSGAWYRKKLLELTFKKNERNCK